MCTFCVHCGTCCGKGKPLTPPGYCPMCGTQNENAAGLCKGCGAPLFTTAAGASQTQAAG